MKKPSEKEAKVIGRLRKALESLPDSLWLFCDGNNVHVMANKENGHRAITGSEGSGYDQDYIIESINVSCDGGDW